MGTLFGNDSLPQAHKSNRSQPHWPAGGDQKDGFISGEPFDLSHNGIFAFYVNVGGGLIEDMDVAAVEQYTGNRQTLALSTEKIGEVFLQLCVQSW